ncbi:ABC transporter permease [Streptococcus orisasini]
MKRIILYMLVLLPLVPIVSLLISSIIIFPITLLPNSILPVNPVWIAEFILGVLLILFGLRLNKFVDKKLFKYSYWIILIILFLVFLKSRLVVLLLQPFLPIFYSVSFEQRYEKIKKFFQKSLSTLAFLNSFDIIYIFIFILILKNHVSYMETKFNAIYDIFKEFHLSQKVIETIIVILMVLLFVILPPLLRARISVKIYKKQNKISVPPEKVLWNSYLEAYFGSALSALMYINLLLQIDNLSFSAILILFIAMSMNIYFWTWAYETINKGGDDKEAEISKWILIGAMIIILFLLDQIKSDLIGIFTWFLPVLLPTFIGKINSQKELHEDDHIPEPTSKMKAHLYWLQIVSFNTLAILNVLSSLFTEKRIERGKLVEVDILKDTIVKAINSVISQSSSSDFLSGILASAIIVLISYFLAQLLSKIIIWLLREYYLDSSKGYFN